MGFRPMTGQLEANMYFVAARLQATSSAGTATNMCQKSAFRSQALGKTNTHKALLVFSLLQGMT
jgi:hypothetical protein